MPHITVDYSASLSGTFDERAFAAELHPLTVKVIDTAIGNCKTHFRCLTNSVVGDGGPDQAVVHVEFGILAGRSKEKKAELTEAVLDLVIAHTAGAEGLTVHSSVDVHETSEAYRKHTATR
ncbi:5-carboxymethyl-2-hydroxymuconate Delta-isomerase [Streptomyces boninensis]|uniref:5-carboxymethyl-2-hydroxymuconate Delta-isomerase n=1 Tax=Streptomyces boninensis TaxID=2039455 RepID=UPI003B2159D3